MPRATAKLGRGLPPSVRNFRSSAGQRTAPSESKSAGRQLTRRCFNDSRRNSSHCSPTSFSRQARCLRQRCCDKLALSPSFSPPLPIQSATVLSRAFRGRAAATGFTTVEASMAGKWLELLKEIAPRTARVASIFHPTSTAGSGSYLLDALNTAAAVLAVEVISAPVHDMSELEAAVSAQAREPNGGLILMPGAYMAAHSAEVASLIGRYRLPSIAPYRFYPEHGGLLSYGYDPLDNFRRAAGYADRILREIGRASCRERV